MRRFGFAGSGEGARCALPDGRSAIAGGSSGSAAGAAAGSSSGSTSSRGSSAGAVSAGAASSVASEGRLGDGSGSTTTRGVSSSGVGSRRGAGSAGAASGSSPSGASGSVAKRSRTTSTIPVDSSTCSMLLRFARKITSTSRMNAIQNSTPTDARRLPDDCAIFPVSVGWRGGHSESFDGFSVVGL